MLSYTNVYSFYRSSKSTERLEWHRQQKKRQFYSKYFCYFELNPGYSIAHRKHRKYFFKFQGVYFYTSEAKTFYFLKKL